MVEQTGNCIFTIGPTKIATLRFGIFPSLIASDETRPLSWHVWWSICCYLHFDVISSSDDNAPLPSFCETVDSRRDEQLITDQG